LIPKKTNKVYVHHRYSNSLFKRIAHNTTDRVFQVKEGKEGVVYCSYQNKPYEFHFTFDIIDYQDGINYINVGQIKDEFYNNTIRGNTNFYDKIESLHNEDSKWVLGIYPHLEKIYELIKDYKNWYVDSILGEKIVWFDFVDEYNVDVLKKCVSKLKYHIILTDNIPVSGANLPSHLTFLLTNTLFFWNNRTDILLYYEYGKNIHKKINFEYLFNYNIRVHRKRRKNIGELLNKEYTFVSQTKWMDEINLVEGNNTHYEPIEGAHLNELSDNVDFFNPVDSYLNPDQVSLDLYFRLLPKGRIQIVNETFNSVKLYSNLKYTHLSEKTYGLILANIPFIPTSFYVLDAIYSILPNCPSYPFEDEIKKYQETPESFVEFIDIFYKNQKEYIPMLENWTKTIHKILITQLEETNSFIDFISKNQENIKKISPI
jgi:hypothetical protein